MKTVNEIALACFPTQGEHVEFAKEVLHLETHGLWPMHAPRLNCFRYCLMSNGYPVDQHMNIAMSYIKMFALIQLTQCEKDLDKVFTV